MDSNFRLSILPRNASRPTLGEQATGESFLLREALAWDEHLDDDAGDRYGSSGELTVLRPQPLSFQEALADLNPEPDYNLTEALLALSPARAQNSSDDSCDENIDIYTSLEDVPKQLSTRTGEVIIKEVADWLDNESTSRLSLHDRSLAQALQASRLLFPPKLLSSEIAPPSELYDMLPSGSREESRATLIYLTVLQLLASTFTISAAPSLPAALYLSSHQRQRPEMISTLRMHSMISSRSPCPGHHARNASLAPVWPALLEKPGREEELADEITRRRVARIRQAEQERNFQKQETQPKELATDQTLVRWMWDGGKAPEQTTMPEMAPEELHQAASSTSNLKRSCEADPIEGQASRKKGKHRQVHHEEEQALERRRIAPSEEQYSASFHDAVRHTRVSSHRRWTLIPVIRSEPHHVFVQPVKELAFRRRWHSWRERRMIRRTRVTSTSPADLMSAVNQPPHPDGDTVYADGDGDIGEQESDQESVWTGWTGNAGQGSEESSIADERRAI